MRPVTFPTTSWQDTKFSKILACTGCIRCWDRHWCDECNHFITLNNTYTIYQILPCK
jgi:hypothetical protein